MSTDSTNSEYYRLFPNEASRHIVISDYILADGINFDQEDIDELSQKISDNTNLYNLIKDHLVPCILPILYSKNIPNPLLIWLPDATKVYNDTLKDLEDIYEKYKKIF